MASSGKMMARDFEFERPLGTGAFSKVMVGLHKPSGVRYAVKLISKQTILNAPTDEERTRMADVARREAKMLRMCNHPSIVKFYASMQTPEDLVYVTELCDGGELLKLINDRGRIPLEAARHAIAELFSAVFYLHTGAKRAAAGATASPMTPNVTNAPIIHRDIKPENIMLNRKKHIKLIDFGTAVVCESTQDRSEEESGARGRAQTFCGTTYYMSPELLQDSYTCCASDYWGCGCVLYHMLTGRRPFDAATPYLLIKAILEQEPIYDDTLDPQAVDLMKQLLIKSPNQRITMSGVMRHPFFSTVNFATLHTTNVEALWARYPPWIDADDVTSCALCKRLFCRKLCKDYCRRCGNIVCRDCLPEQRVMAEYYTQIPQHICRTCCTTLAC